MNSTLLDALIQTLNLLTDTGTITLTESQINSLFEHLDQMGIPHKMSVQIQNEGITTVDDLSKFYKDTNQHISANLQ